MKQLSPKIGSNIYCKFEPCSWQGVLDTTLCDKVCQWLAADQWFSLGSPVSSINKTDRHDIAEILLKVALNTIDPYILLPILGDNLLHYELSYMIYFCFRWDGGNRRTQRKPLICRKSLTNFITSCCIEYTLPWTGFKLTTLVVIGTGSC
jgi:hypothetical protein